MPFWHPGHSHEISILLYPGKAQIIPVIFLGAGGKAMEASARKADTDASIRSGAHSSSSYFHFNSVQRPRAINPRQTHVVTAGTTVEMSTMDKVVTKKNEKPKRARQSVSRGLLTKRYHR